MKLVSFQKSINGITFHFSKFYLNIDHPNYLKLYKEMKKEFLIPSELFNSKQNLFAEILLIYLHTF